MKRILTLIMLVTLTGTLSGCARHVYYAEGTKQMNGTDAVLKPSTAHSPWFPQISSYKPIVPKSAKWNDVGNYWIGWPSSLHLKPGIYLVMFHCTSGSTYAFPSAIVKAEAGKTYTTRCFKAVDNQIGIEVLEVDKSAQSDKPAKTSSTSQ